MKNREGIDNAKLFLKPSGGTKIIRYVSGVHMSLQHRGLKMMAKKLGLNADTLNSGEFIVFMNGQHNAFKLLAANNVICYYRHPNNHRIDPRVISLIPRVFDGRDLKMDDALKEVLRKDFLG